MSVWMEDTAGKEALSVRFDLLGGGSYCSDVDIHMVVNMYQHVIALIGGCLTSTFGSNMLRGLWCYRRRHG